VSQGPQTTGWQPIASAPQDGTEFLIWVRNPAGYEWNGGIARIQEGKRLLCSMRRREPACSSTGAHFKALDVRGGRRALMPNSSPI
jgi:hypothetical protein